MYFLLESVGTYMKRKLKKEIILICLIGIIFSIVKKYSMYFHRITQEVILNVNKKPVNCKYSGFWTQNQRLFFQELISIVIFFTEVLL